MPESPPQPPAPAPEGIARRDFLERGLRLAGGAVAFFAGGSVADAVASAATREAYAWEEHRYAYLIDTEKCIGCGSCVRA